MADGFSVDATLNIVIPALATASIGLAAFFVLRAFGYRRRSSRAAYGVAQQEARQAMLVDFVRGVAAAFVGLILFGVVGLSASPAEVEATATEIRPTPRPSLTAKPTAPPPATNTPIPATGVDEVPTAEPTATSPIPTATPTTLPTVTPSPGPLTATVSSGVGVWLRSAPSTESEQLEWVLDGTVLTLLPGFETADELEWQQVRTPSGLEGWVAAPFIVYNK